MTQERENMAAMARASMVPPKISLAKDNTAKVLCERLEKQIVYAEKAKQEGEGIVVYYTSLTWS